jgi:hypothetical protein
VPRRLLIVIPLLFAVLSLAASPDPAARRPATAADPLADLRRDPPEHSRLLEETRKFLALPPERRERMRRLDEALEKAGGPARQEHLKKVLRRYADWLDRLPPGERQLILEAPTKQTRLRNVREVRETQWLRRQPRTMRSALEALKVAQAALLPLPPPAGAGLAPASALLAPGRDGRSLLVKRLQKEERKRRQEWRIIVRHWVDIGKRPFLVRLGDFRPEVEKYVKEYLLPRLSPAEKERLRSAEGKVVYPYTLVDLADRHPPALPSEHGPMHFNELPTDVQDHLKARVGMMKRVKGWESFFKKQIGPYEGKWPRFAVAMTQLGVKFKTRLSTRFEFWPARPQDLSQEMQKFVEQQLKQKLTAPEMELLMKRQGRWPDYPRTIQELASQHSLQVPWQTLPGERKLWDQYRLRGKVGAAPPWQLPGQPLPEVGPRDRAGFVLAAPAPFL